MELGLRQFRQQRNGKPEFGHGTRLYGLWELLVELVVWAEPSIMYLASEEELLAGQLVREQKLEFPVWCEESLLEIHV